MRKTTKIHKKFFRNFNNVQYSKKLRLSNTTTFEEIGVINFSESFNPMNGGEIGEMFRLPNGKFVAMTDYKLYVFEINKQNMITNPFTIDSNKAQWGTKLVSSKDYFVLNDMSNKK